MAVVNSQTDLENELIAAEQAAARHSITVMKALISGALGLHEVDFTALKAKVDAIHNLLDGDELAEGYQTFAALTAKLDAVELKGNQNAAAITALQTSLTDQLATMDDRINTVESEARTGREALDARITALRTEYEAHVAAKLVTDNQQNTALADHLERIVALEASKALIEGRLGTLETDNTANKSAIAQIQTTLLAQADALQQELTRAQAAEAEIRAELATERARIDGLVTASGAYATRQNVADANVAGAMAFCNKMWEEAGIAMPAGLPMPDGTTSP